MMQNRLTLAFLAASLLPAACSSNSASPSDGGMDSRGPSLDVITVFETSPTDTFVASSNTSAQSSSGSSTADGMAPPQDGGVDGSTHDAKVEASHPADTGGQDVKVSGDTGACTVVGNPGDAGTTTSCTPVTGTCGPASLSGWSPAVEPPVGAHLNKCTSAEEIASVFNDCINGSTCPEADTTNGSYACYSCILPSSGSGKWGPLILPGDFYLLNFGGCIEALSPCNKACATAIDDVILCQDKACDTNCENADGGAQDNCLTTVDSCTENGCYNYNNDAFGVGGCAPQITGAAAACLAPLMDDEPFEMAYTTLATIMCGP